VDRATGTMIPLKLGLVFGAPEASTPAEMEAKIDASIRTGAKLTASRFNFPLDSEGNYTAEFDWEWDEMWGNPGHGVVKEGLSCADCHTEAGIMPFEELGYSETEAATLRGIATGADDLRSPVRFGLAQTFPNPSAGETVLSFSLPRSGTVTLKVYDSNGREVQTIVSDGQFTAGSHDVRFDASSLQNGIYFYVVSFNEQSISKKMVVMN
jgi:hypothetical protein